MKKQYKVLGTIFLVILCLFALISGFQGIKNSFKSSADFQYDSAYYLREKINPYDLSLSHLKADENLTKIYDKVEANQFPSLLLFLVPFTYFPPRTANIIWCFLNIILTFYMGVMIYKIFAKDMNKKLFVALYAMMIAGTGWRVSMGMGQHTIFSLSFFLLAIWLSEKNKKILSGLALAVSYFKYTLTVPITLYFIYKKKYKELIVSAIIHIVITIICALHLGDSVLNMIIKPLQVSSALSAEGYIDIASVFSLKSGMIIAIVACVFLLVLSFLKTEDIEHEHLLFAILTYASLIIIYHRQYDLFVYIIPVIIFAKRYMLQDNKTQNLTILVSGLAIFVYGNFVEKVLISLSNRISLINSISDALHLLYAICVYLFIVYLVVIYIEEYKNAKRANKSCISNI